MENNKLKLNRSNDAHERLAKVHREKSKELTPAVRAAYKAAWQAGLKLDKSKLSLKKRRDSHDIKEAYHIVAYNVQKKAGKVLTKESRRKLFNMVKKDYEV